MTTTITTRRETILPPPRRFEGKKPILEVVYSRPKDWKAMTDEEVLVSAQEKVDSRNIPDAKTFREIFRGINFELVKRGYSADDLVYGKKVESMVVPAKVSDWNALSDDEVRARAQDKITSEGFTSMADFAAVYKGIFVQIYKRGIGEQEFVFKKAEEPKSHVRPIPKKVVDWNALSDEEVREQVQQRIDRHGFTCMAEFAAVYKGIFVQLDKRGIGDQDFVFRKSAVA